ncbi:MAG: hypothetical protein AAFN93_21790 [Bacteroidota bacterium]
MNYGILFSVRFNMILVFTMLTSQWAIGQINDNHDHSRTTDGQARLAFQCAVCSNHLGFVEPNTEIKGGFALSSHKHSLVEVEGLYQCDACKTPIFKAKNELDILNEDEFVYFDRPINNSRINIVLYDQSNLAELKEHCPVCVNKFANSLTDYSFLNTFLRSLKLTRDPKLPILISVSELANLLTHTGQCSLSSARLF